MTENEIIDNLVVILAEQFNRDTDTISTGDKFKDDFEADSLDMVELIVACEEEFKISISDEAVENLVTVQDAVIYLSSIINKS